MLYTFVCRCSSTSAGLHKLGICMRYEAEDGTFNFAADRHAAEASFTFHKANAKPQM